MCIHSNRELEEAVIGIDEVNKQMRESGNPRRVAAVEIRKESGGFVVGWLCNPLDEVSIAQTIADLYSWHVDDLDLRGTHADLSNVNKVRTEDGLPPVKKTGMPLLVHTGTPDVPEGNRRTAAQRSLDKIDYFLNSYLPRQEKVQPHPMVQRLAKELVAA